MILNAAVVIDAASRVETNVVADHGASVHHNPSQHNHTGSEPGVRRNDGRGVDQGGRLDSGLPDHLKIPPARGVVAEGNGCGVNTPLGYRRPQPIGPAENREAEDIGRLLRGRVIQQPAEMPAGQLLHEIDQHRAMGTGANND